MLDEWPTRRQQHARRRSGQIDVLQAGCAALGDTHSRFRLAHHGQRYREEHSRDRLHHRRRLPLVGGRRKCGPDRVEAARIRGALALPLSLPAAAFSVAFPACSRAVRAVWLLRGRLVCSRRSRGDGRGEKAGRTTREAGRGSREPRRRSEGARAQEREKPNRAYHPNARPHRALCLAR